MQYVRVRAFIGPLLSRSRGGPLALQSFLDVLHPHTGLPFGSRLRTSFSASFPSTGTGMVYSTSTSSFVPPS